MTSFQKTYKYLLWLPAVLLTACQDDYFAPDRPNVNPDVISFSASTAAGALPPGSRATDMPEYDPLVLSGEDDDAPLYLHMYETNRIGYQPGEPLAADSRGVQVGSVSDLIAVHDNFTVLANDPDKNNYLGWEATKPYSENNKIWYTPLKHYWPGTDKLTFYAISPESEKDKLTALTIGTTEIDGESKGTMSFSYTARQSEDDKDGEEQVDFLLASKTCNRDGSIDGRAPLLFHHPLAAVKFAVRNVMGGEIINIKLTNIYSTGSCTFTPAADREDGFYECNWTGQDAPVTFSQNFGYKFSDRWDVDPESDNDLIMNDENDISDKMPEKTFMMIPQTISDEAEIIVTMKTDILNEDGTVKEVVEKTRRGRIKLNGVDEWKAGHEYVYTISTTSDNWTYVFEAYGNHDTETDAHGALTDATILKGNQIYVYSPLASEFETYGDNAYMGVRSFRYRTNKPSVIEPLKWTATHGDTKQYRVRETDVQYTEIEKKVIVEANTWIPKDKASENVTLLPGTSTLAFTGNGSSDTSGELVPIEFYEHHAVTDWQGDIDMQNYESYPGNTKETPWDLSTCGGNIQRSTANSYIVDRTGYYVIPLVYGNAITNGEKNEDAYIYPGDDLTYNLKNFCDHNGKAISDPWITAAYSTNLSADLVWADVSGVFKDFTIVDMADGKKGLRFYIDGWNIQQGNGVIALYQGNDIVWSWHIWLTEHWLDPTTGIPEVFSKSRFTYEKTTAEWRQRGDVLIDNRDCDASRNYEISAYNLGWCDPKNVDYLKRKETMTFTQYVDGKARTNTITIPIVQDGCLIEYKYGNNTYYQWGRKDPSIGYLNRESVDNGNNKPVKNCFGPKKSQGKVGQGSLSDGIRNPHIFYEYNNGNDSDWNPNSKINYWNNTWTESADFDNDDEINKYTHTVKTVYDPCPPGYTIPSSYALRFIGKSDNPHKDELWTGKPSYRNGNSDNKTINYLNGYPSASWSRVLIDSKYKPTNPDTPYHDGEHYTKNPSTKDEDIIWLPTTGNRFRNQFGWNFNAFIVYAWSSTSPRGIEDIGNTGGGRYPLGAAYCLSLGSNTNIADDLEYLPDDIVVCTYFIGGKAFGRPIRPIREQKRDSHDSLFM